MIYIYYITPNHSSWGLQTNNRTLPVTPSLPFIPPPRGKVLGHSTSKHSDVAPSARSTCDLAGSGAQGLLLVNNG